MWVSTLWRDARRTLRVSIGYIDLHGAVKNGARASSARVQLRGQASHAARHEATCAANLGRVVDLVPVLRPINTVISLSAYACIRGQRTVSIQTPVSGTRDSAAAARTELSYEKNLIADSYPGIARQSQTYHSTDSTHREDLDDVQAVADPEPSHTGFGKDLSYGAHDGSRALPPDFRDCRPAEIWRSSDEENFQTVERRGCGARYCNDDVRRTRGQDVTS